MNDSDNMRVEHLIKLTEQLLEKDRKANEEKMEIMSNDKGFLPLDDSKNTNVSKKYSIIYADPPWFFKKKKLNFEKMDNSSSHYSFMKEKELIKLTPFINRISKENCALFLWTTNAHHELAYRLMRAWGFEPVNYAFVWMKINRGDGKPRFGTGYYTKSNVEICLFGKKGSIVPISNTISQMIVEPIREHSRKPDIARKKIVDLLGDLSKIELFARQKTEGWDVWGKESCPGEFKDESPSKAPIAIQSQDELGEFEIE